MADNKKRITEQDSIYDHLEQMSTSEILTNMNQEDQKVPLAIKEVIKDIEKLVDASTEKILGGGRLFYIGAGTSGRLGVLDASECPPTFGVPDDVVIGLIAGGDYALRKAVENAEDDVHQAWKDLLRFEISEKDVLIGIAASGSTPYVVGGVREARKKGVITGCVTCNPESPLASAVEYPVACVVGPEFVTGSTRLKAGTAQKLILNMISTSIMIKLGRVRGNKMVDMQLSNHKLVERGVRMIVEELKIDKEKALMLLQKHGSVRKVLKQFNQ